MLPSLYTVAMTEQPNTDPGIFELKTRLSDFVNRVIYRREVVYVTKNRKRVAALVPVDLWERAEAALKASESAES